MEPRGIPVDCAFREDEVGVEATINTTAKISCIGFNCTVREYWNAIQAVNAAAAVIGSVPANYAVGERRATPVNRHAATGEKRHICGEDLSGAQ